DGQPPPVGQWEDAFFADEPSFALGPRSAYRSQFTNHSTVLLLLTVLPALWVIELGARNVLEYWCVNRRYLAGQCRSCGYDLAGNASGVCPECGTPADGSGPPERITGAGATLWCAVRPGFSDRARRRALVVLCVILGLVVMTSAVVYYVNRPAPPRY